MLQREFGNLLNECFQNINEKSISTEEVKKLAMGMFSLLSGVFDDAETPDDIFITITIHGLWDYLNYEPVNIIAMNLSLEKCVLKIKKYKESLQCCYLSDIISLKQSDIAPLDLQFMKFSVRIRASIKLQVERVEFVSKLSTAIASHIGLNLTVLLLKSITKDPFIITWFLPAQDFVIDKICKDSQWLHDRNIIDTDFDHKVIPSQVRNNLYHNIILEAQEDFCPLTS